MWSEIIEGSPQEGEFAWQAAQGWIQLRILGSLAGSRLLGNVLPCALCVLREVTAPPEETARHLLWEREQTREAAEQVFRKDYRTPPWTVFEAEVLGGKLPAPELARAIKFIGHLARRVWRARPAASRVEQDMSFQQWLHASGIIPMILAK